MEAKSAQKKSTKNFLNKFFHPNNSSKKNTSTVSPQENGWFPTFVADLPNHDNPSPYSNATTRTRYSNEELFKPQYKQRSSSSTKSLSSSSSSTTSSSSSSSTSSTSPSVSRSNSVQRRYSFSNVHESGRQRLLAAKRAEYQEKMRAFDDLIQRRRGSTLRLALAPDVTSY